MHKRNLVSEADFTAVLQSLGGRSFAREIAAWVHGTRDLPLKELLERDSAFAQALGATATTEAAAKLAAEHGVVVAPEALWRHRGTLVSGGLPTWRG